MKKTVSKSKRVSLIIISTVLLVSFFVSTLLFFEDSIMRADYGEGRSKNFFVPFYERENVPFENSQLFTDLYESSIEDITRMCVIKNQLETNGEYDPKKVIDISEYANRNDVINTDSATAEYYLDDLIKWGNKGFDAQTVDAASLPFYVDSDTYSVIIPRYRTVEGKDLLLYAHTQEEYDALMKNLMDAANSLFENYKEYLKFEKTYGVGRTNVFYCYQMVSDEKLVRYTNLEAVNNCKSADDITSVFSKQVKYLYFNPDKMTISTNSGINAAQMKGIINKYEYSFADNSRIWIGFDEKYNANDSFKVGKENYESKSGNTTDIIIVSISLSSLILYIILFVILTKDEGLPFASKKKKIKVIEIDEDVDENGDPIEKESTAKDKEEQEETKEDTAYEGSLVNGYRTLLIDSIPLEPYIIVFAAFVVLWLFAGYESVWVIYDRLLYNPLAIAVCVGLGLFLNLTFMPIWLCLVRKIKTKTIFRNSLVHGLIEFFRETSKKTNGHNSVILRTWIPYIIFLLVNLILVMLLNEITLLLAVMFDACVGVRIMKNNIERKSIIEGIKTISDGNVKYKLDENKMHGDNRDLATAVNNIGEGISKAVETSMKDEKMKADLITNVSHDIKTPLTSIINYVDLIKRENIKDEKIRGYIEVLDQKSQRLKQLTDDLVEASKISSGNITLNFVRLNVNELIYQSIGEFDDKFKEHRLNVMTSMPEESVFIKADAKSVFRIIENLYNNIYKYAMEGTRVYVNLEVIDNKAKLSFKNISETQINYTAEELLERFKQGDDSRKSEGSGLGLSIAKNLTEAMDGTFEIILDGDLFKIDISFNVDGIATE